MLRQVIYAVGIVVLAIAGIAYTIIAGNEPLLGLDLQGGASVVLEPEPNEDGSEISDEVLDQAVEIIRNRVDGLGVREPEISRAGSTILVQIPGVEDQQRAIDLVGQTAELRFRPLLQETTAELGFAPEIAALCPGDAFTAANPDDTAATDAAATDKASSVADDTAAPEDPVASTEPASTEPASTEPASTEPASTEPVNTDPASTDPASTEPVNTDPASTDATSEDVPTDDVPTDDVPTDDVPTDDAPTEPAAPTPLFYEPTPQADADECMVALHRDIPEIRYLLGPAPLLIAQEQDPGARLTGEVLETAIAQLQLAEWVVNISFKAGSPGIDDFNALAAQCASGTAICPPTGTTTSGEFVGRVAVEIDGVVESAPTVGISNFDRSGVVISGGAMTEQVAKDLALVLRFGSLPVELTPQESRIVSSTLGEDALDAGIVAGLIGLGLVSLYLLFYYRFLGVVAVLSLAISGALLWTMIAWLGGTQGLALTLAGVTGLIVSIGVSVDSNVVYFEHLKEDVRAGRTVRSSVERSFPIAFSTIVKADVASLIAAVVLYFLTVGQVKGFALFLGLATVLDLVATYFFMGPVIRLMARREAMSKHPKRFGISTAQTSTAQLNS